MEEVRAMKSNEEEGSRSIEKKMVCILSWKALVLVMFAFFWIWMRMSEKGKG